MHPKKIFDASHDEYSGYIPALNKFLANAEITDISVYGEGNYWINSENESMILMDDGEKARLKNSRPSVRQLMTVLLQIHILKVMQNKQSFTLQEALHCLM